MSTLSRETVSPEEKQQALERVLRSHAFSRSDQLRRFLQYICEKEFTGNAQKLNEYSIAVEALGRPVNYSPAEDSSVRTRAHALRQKLQEYYELEEVDANVQIQVPKGSYHPQFLREKVSEPSYIVDIPLPVPQTVSSPARLLQHQCISDSSAVHVCNTGRLLPYLRGSGAVQLDVSLFKGIRSTNGCICSFVLRYLTF